MSRWVNKRGPLNCVSGSAPYTDTYTHTSTHIHTHPHIFTYTHTHLQCGGAVEQVQGSDLRQLRIDALEDGEVVVPRLYRWDKIYRWIKREGSCIYKYIYK
jgi:hypothetical protein